MGILLFTSFLGGATKGKMWLEKEDVTVRFSGHGVGLEALVAWRSYSGERGRWWYGGVGRAGVGEGWADEVMVEAVGSVVGVKIKE